MSTKIQILADSIKQWDMKRKEAVYQFLKAQTGPPKSKFFKANPHLHGLSEYQTQVLRILEDEKKSL